MTFQKQEAPKEVLKCLKKFSVMKPHSAFFSKKKTQEETNNCSVVITLAILYPIALIVLASFFGAGEFCFGQFRPIHVVIALFSVQSNLGE